MESGISPVTSGGLGVRSAVKLSPSAFLAATNSSQDLVSQILPSRIQDTFPPHLAEAKGEWTRDNDERPTTATVSHHRKVLELCEVVVTADRLLEANLCPV